MVLQYAKEYQFSKLMVTHSPLATKNWAGSVEFAPGQEKL